MTGKTVIVTGASRGIGRSIAVAFAKSGANIVAADVLEDVLAQTCVELEKLGVQALPVKVDVSKPADTDALAEAAVKRFGRIDVLVNNAGITRDTLILRMKEEQWDSVLSVNLKGAFNCIKSCSRHIMKQDEGRIVNIASVIGIRGNAGQANYAASKAGLIALTKSAAREFASRNITVNAVAPGFIQTDMTAALPEDVKKAMMEQIPLHKLGVADDVANAVLFLSGNLASYITGQVIVVDGGMVM